MLQRGCLVSPELSCNQTRWGRESWLLVKIYWLLKVESLNPFKDISHLMWIYTVPYSFCFFFSISNLAVFQDLSKIRFSCNGLFYNLLKWKSLPYKFRVGRVKKCTSVSFIHSRGPCIGQSPKWSALQSSQSERTSKFRDVPRHLIF